MNPIRAAAQEKLSDIRGAFLRCDRGDALYVTNAAVRSQREIDWAAAGFDAQMQGKMTFLIPKDEWVSPFEAWLRPQVEYTHLYDCIGNADFGLIEDEDRQLFIAGVKQLEMRSSANYEKAVRQRAAVCLRTKRGGGTLGVCALIADMMREKKMLSLE